MLICSIASRPGFTNDEEAACGLLEHLPKHSGGLQTCGDVLAARGARFTQADAWNCHVAVAEAGSRVVTGQNPMSAGAVGEAIVAAVLA